jgi:hypothetical protein
MLFVKDSVVLMINSRLWIKYEKKTYLKSIKRTDNKMTKRKRMKGQPMMFKILHRKLKIKQHDPIYTQGQEP